MTNVSETQRVEWAVRWTPGGAWTATGAKPPWAADYERWKRSKAAVVFRKVTVEWTFVEVEEGDWEEVSLSTANGEAK